MTAAELDLLTVTADELRRRLDEDNVRSVDLVESYVAQIARFNDRLKAVAKVRPLEALRAEAAQLDKERHEGKTRSQLHGIPYIIKDNTDTHPKYGLETTAGSFALLENQAQRNADLVQSLEDAGAILIGKATLSELNFWKGTGLPCGWSAMTGQGQSAYVRGGVDPDDTFAGHSSPGGSSSGSAIAVSAGMVPLSIGTETDGSVVMPANRAALFAIKHTFGLSSSKGIIPLHPQFDTPGLMAKSAVDLGMMLDALLQQPKARQYERAAAEGSWANIRVAALDPTIWRQPPHMIKPVESATAQMTEEINAAYDLIAKHAKVFKRNITTFTPQHCFDINKKLPELFKSSCRDATDIYLQDLATSKVRTLEALVQFNFEHAVEALPGNTNQDLLVASLNPELSQPEAAQVLDGVRQAGRAQGIDKALEEHAVDVIIGPADSPMTKLPSAAGYPVVTLPLSYLDFNGRPFGLVATTSAHGEQKLMELLGAWESIMPARRPPPSLVSSQSSGSL